MIGVKRSIHSLRAKRILCKNATVAQLVEPAIRNGAVEGSSPFGGFSSLL